ncbi:chlorophyll synthesis pathway protein BchC [Enterococcus sp. DIV2402]|uniref:Chlorophyll synthesis pathway protein BchC n=1 Tax=Candidatus Enterococcus lowellii TaxID=2230877 RepID=A0ABZ2SS25_9ENTE|nr:alcohol dehydrogenase catalytic domain-containing protein [Enterococcus sp. DIV2402]MBO0463278.1 alcohol dehydrogenase catalytic domain-containing protein [Enterococcus sp. DIV2402]
MTEIQKQRFGVLTKKGQIEVHERPLPKLGDYDILIKHEACNICTTDYTQYLGLREHQGYPMAGGHEDSGFIVEVGEKVNGFSVGDHVALGCPSCGYCDECKKGREGFCKYNDMTVHTTEDGYHGTFGFSDYVVMPARRVVKISKHLPAGEGGFLEPLATVSKGIKIMDTKPGDTVVVIGAGTMGMLNALALRAKAIRVIITEFMPNKIENARKEGLEVIDCNVSDPVEEVKKLTDGEGADAVYVCVGNTVANNQAVEMLKKYYGKILLFAASYPEPKFEISSNVIHYRHIQIFGTTGADLVDFIDSAKLLNSGQVKVTSLLEKKYFDLDHIKDAFEEATVPGNYRVTVRMNDL